LTDTHIGDGNGGTGSFFWIPIDRTKTATERNADSVFQQLNNEYSLFGHVIEGNDVMERLKLGDILLNATIEDGIWRLEEENIEYNGL
jgi:cyclophilin family peptidyl-prolyl cis-trans isomerase